VSLSPGAIAQLQQAYRSSWHQYLASLRDEQSTFRVWDLVVLTASNERQAEAYEAQIEARRSAGLLSGRTEFLVIPDPKGARIGSGGATLHVLTWLADHWCPSHDGGPGTDGDAFAGKRVLIVHSGGDSKRLPHCSAIGKLFARVPHELPDGRPSSLFDEFLVAVSGLPGQIPEGVLVSSGDVLLLFDHLQLDFQHPGVTGVGALASPEQGAHHGVYVTAPGGNAVKAFLHKPSVDRMRSEGALKEGAVAIDTGLVWLDHPTVVRLLALGRELSATIGTGVPINLYGDLLAPLAEMTRLDDYLVDSSDGEATPQLQAVRRRVWESLRGTAFGVETLRPAVFEHFGTTREYLAVLRQRLVTFSSCGWRGNCASWLDPVHAGQQNGDHVLVNSYVAAGSLASGCVADSSIEGYLILEDGSLLANVITERPSLDVQPGVVLHQVTLKTRGGFVTRVYGTSDDPKKTVQMGGTFLGRPWQEWLASGVFSVEDLWPTCDDPSQRSLWNARLYPVCADREASLESSLWLQSPTEASAETRMAWRSGERVSLEESYLDADVRQIVAEVAQIEDKVRSRQFVYGVEREEPAADIAECLGMPRERPRRARLAADLLEASSDPWLPLRGYQALSVATGDQHWEDRAFSSLARLVRAHTPSSPPARLDSGASVRSVNVRAAARIDFGGGWTDTPPYSLEHGGTVFNAAITLRNEYPIMAEATLLDEPLLLLESADIDAGISPKVAAEVLDYARPADPFSLHKAALVFRGIVPGDTSPEADIADVLRNRGYGLHLRTSTCIPRGSGLGTSSIVAGVVLRSLTDVLGQTLSEAELFDHVLCLEQMITTGGGWQDQIGGLAGGIKLIRTQPGLPQVADVQQVALTPSLCKALDTRLRLVYTGQRRLAKDLLRRMMRRYMSRDPDLLSMLQEIARLALAMRDALADEDLDGLGRLLAEHWRINVRMDPGCTNPFIDDLLAFCAPFSVGAKLAGAGGGGFAIVVAEDGDAAVALEKSLEQRFAGGSVAVWPCSVAMPGMIAEARCCGRNCQSSQPRE